MSTACTFTPLGASPTVVQGIVTASHEGEFVGVTDRSGISGLNGEDEITQGQRGVSIDVVVWLYGFADDAALISYIAGTLKPLLNKNGFLEITGAITRSYNGTTFDSLEPVDRPTTQEHDVALGRVQTWRMRFRCLNP